MELHYPSDIKAVAAIPDDRKEAFEIWMAALDAEYVKHGSPYGEGPLAKVTGIECWIPPFEDEMSPEEALLDDFSNT